MRRALVMVIALSSFQSIAIADWANLWSTPEQRARKAFESGDHEALLDQAPDENWKGLGQFQSGDYDAASQTFSEMDTPQAFYNRAVSDAMGGRYQEALANFDMVLADDPEHRDAAHNREIVQKLIELQEQQQSQQGEQGDGSDQSQEQGEQQQDQQQSQDGQQTDDSSQGDEQSQQQGSDQNNEQSPGNDGNQQSDTDSGGTQSDAEQSAEDARQALAAEAEQSEQSEDAGTEQSEASGISEEERPLTESEQATEQWLRRIPDDPAGLLRRKLEQSHRNEFPEVRDAIDPW